MDSGKAQSALQYWRSSRGCQVGGFWQTMTTIASRRCTDTFRYIISQGTQAGSSACLLQLKLPKVTCCCCTIQGLYCDMLWRCQRSYLFICLFSLNLRVRACWQSNPGDRTSALPWTASTFSRSPVTAKRRCRTALSHIKHVSGLLKAYV